MIRIEGNYKDNNFLGIGSLTLKGIEVIDIAYNQVCYVKGIFTGDDGAEYELTFPDYTYERTWEDTDLINHIYTDLLNRPDKEYEVFMMSNKKKSIFRNNKNKINNFSNNFSIKLPWYKRLWNTIKNFFTK